MSESFATPKSSAPPSLKKSSSNKQTSIAGFFQKKAATASHNGSALPVRQSPKRKARKSIEGSDQSLTPAPSSDPIEHEEEANGPAIASVARTDAKPKSTGLPSPVTPAVEKSSAKGSTFKPASSFYSPSRKVTRGRWQDLYTCVTNENTSRPRRLYHM